MKGRYSRLLPVLVGSLIAIVLTTLLLRVRYQLEATRALVQLHTLLETVSADLDAELQQGESVLSAPVTLDSKSGWHSWYLDANGYRDAENRPPPISESAVRRALTMRSGLGDQVLLLGIFATEQGPNALLLARPIRDAQGGRAWRGAWSLVDDIMWRAGVIDLVKRGYRLELYDPTDASALYETDSGELQRPVTIPLRFGESPLQLRAAARDGSAVPMRMLSSALMVILVVVLWLSYERQHGSALRNASAEVTEAEARRRALNITYGKALDSIAGLESRLQLTSTYDGATGLANRSSLVRRMEATLDAMRQSQKGTLWVMSIGFNQVHHLTSSFGAVFASRVLVIAAERVQLVLPSKELLFRAGDFHLAVVLPDAEASGSETLAQKIVTAIESPINLESHTFLLHPSIGIACAESGYDDAESLLDHANAALDAVPFDALTRYCLFDSTTTRESISRLQLEVDLDRAFEENQFVLEYEPFIVPVSHAAAGFEALIRWEHPTEGRLMPSRFVPIASQGGMSHRLNAWVMRETVRQAAMWRRAGYDELFVNFNLSAEAFVRPQLVDEIGALLAEFELPGSQLNIELTESTLLQDVRGAVRTLQGLSELGVGAWLDDFGTGYSSLSHLRALPLKGVKIDRSFIEQIDLDTRDFGFLKALIDLISYLGMQSIAEGVETVSHYELLGLTTCDLYQGYYFSRSMSATEAERWMGERTHKRLVETPSAHGAQELRRSTGGV